MLEDTKQTKIAKKIANSLKHGNEGQLGTKNNDECYTDANDILRELSKWAALGKFQDKNIICPCDWDILQDKETGEYGVLEYKGKKYVGVYGIKIIFDTDKFKVLSNNVYKCVKRVEFQSFAGDLWAEFNEERPAVAKTTILTHGEKININEEDFTELLSKKLTCNFIKVLVQNARTWGIKSITASGYNPANGMGIPFQDIDYSEYDICITNPPFSLYKEFMKCIVSNIDFIILAPLMNRIAPSIAEPLMLKQAYLGFGIELHLKFNNPTKDNLDHTKIVNCDWITSYSEAQQERNNKHFKSGIKYETYKDEFIEMPNMTMKDGTHPIKVSMSTYPDDYDGWMLITVGVLDNLDQDAYDWIITSCKGFFNKKHPELNPFAHQVSDAMFDVNGTRYFNGQVLFRKKPAKENNND